MMIRFISPGRAKSQSDGHRPSKRKGNKINMNIHKTINLTTLPLTSLTIQIWKTRRVDIIISFRIPLLKNPEGVTLYHYLWNNITPSGFVPYSNLFSTIIPTLRVLIIMAPLFVNPFYPHQNTLTFNTIQIWKTRRVDIIIAIRILPFSKPWRGDIISIVDQ